MPICLISGDPNQVDMAATISSQATGAKQCPTYLLPTLTPSVCQQIKPSYPASGPATRSFNGLHLKSKLLTFIILAAAACIVSPLSGQQPADAFTWVDPVIPKPDSEGWITLFDGAKLYGCSPDEIRASMNQIGVSNEHLWINNFKLNFNISARDVIVRAWVKKASGRHLSLGLRNLGERSYVSWYNGNAQTKGSLGIGLNSPAWQTLVATEGSRNYDDFFPIELAIQGHILSLKIEDRILASIQNEVLNEPGSVTVNANRSHFLFKKIQVKILDGPPPPPSWANTTGVAIQAEFIRLDGEILFISKDGKEFRIPLNKLSGTSREQARKLAAAMPRPAVAEPAVPAEAPAVAESKQTDPDHQRKLAESILSKKNGRVEIWRGSGLLTVTQLDTLPKGKLSLKAVSSVDGPFTVDDAALLNGCQELTGLEIHRGSMTSLPLKSLSALSSLTLVSCQLDKSTFRGLRGNKNLVNANTSGVQLETEIVEILATCPNLRNLTLERCGLEKVSLLPLKRLKLLTSLNIGGNALTGEELQEIAEIPLLENLALPYMELAGESLAFLPKLKTTSSLNLINCKISSKALASAAAMPQLKRLELWNTDITDEMLVTLGGKRDLEYLGLEHTACTGEGFAKLGLLPKLGELRFQGSRTRVSDAGILAIVKACPSLQALSLGGKYLSPTGIGHIVGLKQLAELRLNEAVSLDNSTIASLAGMRKLAILEISSSSLTDGQVTLFEPMKGTLNTLYVHNNRISDACVETLKQMKALKLLEISGTDISKEAVAGLRASLTTCEIRY
jgi:Leucine-rich repeat (LRR) protein